MNRPSILALLLIAAMATACGGEDEVSTDPILRSVRYVRVSDDQASLHRSFSGSIRAGNQSRLAFQVGGRVQDVGVRGGEQVERGQQIAQLDPADFELQLQEARASAAQARAQAVSASANYDRVRQLYESNNASRQDLDTSRAAKDSANSAASAAGQGVRRLQRQLDYATLSAPGAGTISEISIETSEVVSPGQVVAVLQVGEELEVAVGVPEALINQVEVGGAATVRVAALDNAEMDGVIHEVGTPSGGGAVFPVSVRVEGPAEGLRAGMAADVMFDIESTGDAQALRIPATAVGEDEEGRFVYTIETERGPTGILRRTGVEVGGLEADGIEILEGVEVGDLVVIRGVARVSDGLEVMVPPGGGMGEVAPEASEDEQVQEAEEEEPAEPTEPTEP